LLREWLWRAISQRIKDRAFHLVNRANGALSGTADDLKSAVLRSTLSAASEALDITFFDRNIIFYDRKN
jgi:hypothetical protein